jgi:cytochrome c2
VLHTFPFASGQRGGPPDRPAASPWADWIEPDFPFYSSVIDGRTTGAPFPAGNLTPRGLVLDLGRGYWAGFDTDLLRVAAIWEGHALTPRALAPGSYHHPDRKTPGGQSPLPEPDGTVRLANGIYPGWQQGTHLSFADPRDPAPSPEEVGRGPLPEHMGRFTAVRHVRDGVVLEYTAGPAAVREWLTVPEGTGEPTVQRHFEVGPSSVPLLVVLGVTAADARVVLGTGEGVTPALEQLPAPSVPEGSSEARGGVLWAVRVPAHSEPVAFCAALGGSGATPAPPRCAIPGDPPAVRWPQEVATAITRSTATDPFVVDDVALPTENPWRRHVRVSDVQFLTDGTGFAVTLEGDIWKVQGLHEPSGPVRWRRFASGLHEPLTLAIRDEQVYVFDRNGIWRLRDTNGDGEADVHELFSNAFGQTADMREFPNTLRLGPNGEFVIAKGNQQAATIGKHNGSVLRISADGRRATELGYGFRQPNIGVNVHTGLVTASDQQGHYIPTTPLHVVRDRQFYGFLSDKLPREVYPAPIAEPLTWMPHAANASAMSQIWMFGARMGPLTDRLVHIGFNNPELFLVLLNERTMRQQAALVSITRALDIPVLNGSVNPADGQLYLAGFQILGWGTTATRLEGMARVRYTGAPSTIPRDVVPMQTGILLRFDVPLDPVRAADPDSYAITSWQYRRTYQYGSPQFRADGTPGIDRHAPSRAYLSRDRRSVFVAVPGMTPVMQMRVAWSIATAEGTPFQESAYFTPYELAPFDPHADGFGELTIDLTPRAVAEVAAGPVTVEEGRRLSQLYGCLACHAVESDAPSRLGPTWKGLYGSQRPYAKGVLHATADDAYLKEAIFEPAAKVVSGYERGEAGMPSYRGVLTEQQVEAILLYIKELR